MTKLTFTKIKTFIKHNPWIVVVSVIAILIALWLAGCEASGPSPMDPERKITRTELEIEVKTFLARAKFTETSIANKEKLRDLVLRQTFMIAQGGAINYFSLGNSILAILGIGSMLDNRRKDSIIKIKKEENRSLKNADRTN